MENRDKYLWRPNDNSVKTNLRYDIEASKWMDSIKNSSPSPTPSFGEVSGFLGLLFSFVFNLIWFIALNVIDLVKWIRKALPKKKDKFEGVPHFDNKPPLSDEEGMAIIKKANETCVIREIDLS